MARLVAVEGGNSGYNFVQLYVSPSGELIFPDELGAACIAQAILSGQVFHRILDPEVNLTKQPRQVQIIVGVSHSEDGSSGLNYYEAHHPARQPDVPLNLPLSQELSTNPSLSPELDGPRKISTVRKHGSSLANFSQPQPESPAISNEGRILLQLLSNGDELFNSLIPNSQLLQQPDILQKISTLSKHQLAKLSLGGFRSSEITNFYATINSLVQTINLISSQIFPHQADPTWEV